MKFVVDNQLPLQLARFLGARGHDAVHVTEVALDEATDRTLWDWAIDSQRVVVSKDEDFLFLAKRAGDDGRLLWIRLGNCRKVTLLTVVERALDSVLAAFSSGQRIVELG